MHLKIPQKTKDNPCFPVQSDDKIWKHSPHIGLHPSDKQHCQACGRFCIFCVCLMNSPAKLVGFPFSLFRKDKRKTSNLPTVGKKQGFLHLSTTHCFQIVTIKQFRKWFNLKNNNWVLKSKVHHTTSNLSRLLTYM